MAGPFFILLRRRTKGLLLPQLLFPPALANREFLKQQVGVNILERMRRRLGIQGDSSKNESWTDVRVGIPIVFHLVGRRRRRVGGEPDIWSFWEKGGTISGPNQVYYRLRRQNWGRNLNSRFSHLYFCWGGNKCKSRTLNFANEKSARFGSRTERRNGTDAKKFSTFGFIMTGTSQVCRPSLTQVGGFCFIMVSFFSNWEARQILTFEGVIKYDIFLHFVMFFLIKKNSNRIVKEKYRCQINLF